MCMFEVGRFSFSNILSDLKFPENIHTTLQDTVHGNAVESSVDRENSCRIF